MILGYARTSSVDQVAGLEAQIRDLTQIGADEIFSEQVSSVEYRPEWASLMMQVKPGDVIAVTKLDRLARSTSNLLSIVAELESKMVGLIILSMSGQRIDTRSPTGKLMITLLGAVAAFERELMLERQKEGIAAAKRAGKYKGKPPTSRVKIDEAMRLIVLGIAPKDVARRLKMGRSTLYRWLAMEDFDAPKLTEARSSVSKETTDA